MSRLAFEILQSYNTIFLGNIRSRKIGRRLGINISSIQVFDPIFPHHQIFADAPRADDFSLLRERLCLLQHRLATFRPQRWRDLLKGGGYAQPIVAGAVWFMTTVIVLVIASIVATILVTALTR
jgi:hypothetical protein